MGKNIPLKIGLSDEIEQFVARKKTRSTRATYKGAYQQFLIYYRKQHGGKATILDFVEVVYDDLDKPLRERQRVADRMNLKVPLLQPNYYQRSHRRLDLMSEVCAREV